MIAKCDFCFKSINRIPSLIKRVKNSFCNRSCLGKWKKLNQIGSNNPRWNGRLNKSCLTCNKEFDVIISRNNAKFCSRECAGKSTSKIKIGKDNSNWKGGITPAYLSHHLSKDYQNQRIKRLEIDKYTCQKCGKTKENNVIITIHHIIPWKITKDDSINNLITLCLPCHMTMEKTGKARHGHR